MVVSLIADYEQQYAVLSAEITAEIGKLGRSSAADDRRQISQHITSNIDEVQELLEQIGLEIREADAAQRQTLTGRLNCYHAELRRLQAEFHRIGRQPPADSTSIQLFGGTDGDGDASTDFDALGGGGSSATSLNTEQQARLLDNSERIERSGNRLADGYRTILETESIGASVLADLSAQRETLQRSRSRLRETNEDLRQANKSINAMILRALREKLVLYGIGTVFVVAVSLSLYFSLSH